MSIIEKPSRQQSIGDGVAVQIDAISAELLEQISQARAQLDRAETNLLDQAAQAKRMIAGVIDATTAIIAASYSFSKTVHSVAANNARPLVIEKEPQNDDQSFDRDNTGNDRSGNEVRSNDRS